mgnify:CR=1 FL=1
MSTDQQHDHAEVDAKTVVKQREPEAAQSKLETFGWALVRWWGILFRTVFISLVGIIGYLWLDPQSVGDVPLAELTLNRILKNLFAVLLAIGCVSWFFKFPDQRDSKSPEENPYVTWGRFGGLVILVAALGIYWLSKQ